MSRRLAIETALAAWRDAERRLGQTTDEPADELQAEVESRRGEFQRLAASQAADQLDRLRATEFRRKLAIPRMPPFDDTAYPRDARQRDQDRPTRARP